MKRNKSDDKVVRTARHESGVICVLTFIGDGSPLKSNISFRGDVPLVLIDSWQLSWNEWIKKVIAGDYLSPPPDGWKMVS